MRGAAGPGRLRHRVLASVNEHALWAPGDAVAVAVSGGLDSVALLDLLHCTRAAHGGELQVVTVDHGTRESSRGDAAFVRDLAASLDLPFVGARFELGADASEAACREARHSVFRGLDARRVALAHHRDDQAETVLLQLLRGTGTRGLAGMRWRSGRLVRPLLDVRRAELEAWAEHRGLRWREDPTNTDRRFLRNRVRAEVMPLLESLRPGAVEALARSAAVAGEDDAWLTEAARAQSGGSADGLDVEWVANGPPALIGRAILAIAPATSAAQIREIRGAARRGAGAVRVESHGLWEVVPLDGGTKVVRFRTAPLSGGP